MAQPEFTPDSGMSKVGQCGSQVGLRPSRDFRKKAESLQGAHRGDQAAAGYVPWDHSQEEAGLSPIPTTRPGPHLAKAPEPGAIRTAVDPCQVYFTSSFRRVPPG